ncbi:MAG: sulfatase-like hydrolase/transferase [Pirellulaceae bacterium]
MQKCLAGIYANRDWPDPDKGQAAMITRMDGDIGRLLDLLNELSIDENTLVFFTSDNGPHDESNHDLERFNPSGPLTGIKRSLTEGGVRVPMIARWPGKIKAGTVSEHVGYFADVLPTLIDLTGAKTEVTTDGISFLPTLTGSGKQKEHEYLYWEFYEQGSRQSVRFGDWVAIRQPMFSGSASLFNLKQDIAEQNDLAKQHPELVAKAVAYMEQAHTPNQNWAPSGAPVKK